MFKVFTFKTLTLLAVIAAVAGTSAAPALAKKKQNVPGHWERSEDGGFEWVGKKPKKPMAGEPVVRDHRTQPVVRDHRTQPVVRDHRSTTVAGASGGITVTTSDSDRNKPKVRDHRRKKFIGFPF
ncbi:MAG: hypothetical protein AB7F09_02760 [Parvibaculaceae bacterium]